MTFRYLAFTTAQCGNDINSAGRAEIPEQKRWTCHRGTKPDSVCVWPVRHAQRLTLADQLDVDMRDREPEPRSCWTPSSHEYANWAPSGEKLGLSSIPRADVRGTGVSGTALTSLRATSHKPAAVANTRSAIDATAMRGNFLCVGVMLLFRRLHDAGARRYCR